MRKRLGFDRLHREQRRQRELERVGVELARVKARLAAGKRPGLMAFERAIDVSFMNRAGTLTPPRAHVAAGFYVKHYTTRRSG